jgi:hypothetical protein
VKQVNPLTIGIDATNLRGGGGVTHLVELLRVVESTLHSIDRVVVWGGTHTLKLLKTKGSDPNTAIEWIEKIKAC